MSPFGRYDIPLWHASAKRCSPGSYRTPPHKRNALNREKEGSMKSEKSDDVTLVIIKVEVQ
jgi:hypothetical protein